MKHWAIGILLCLGTKGAAAQFYFNDLVSTKQSNDQFKLLRTLKIKTITATSFEADNSPTEGFSLVQEISQDGKKVTIQSNTGTENSSTTTHTYELNRIRRAVSVRKGIESKTTYSYESDGRISNIQLTTSDTAMRSVLNEIHLWQYDANGKPVAMLKIKNNTDTTQVNFVMDEQGNIAEEQWKKNGRTIETYYYYYNARNELTDIVRYNSRLKKLVPDLVYEYDTAGRIAQMTQYSIGSNNYFTWKYSYSEKGIKEQEICTDKSKRLVGTIRYTYQ